eukprot:jgi/Chrzof1/95/Cz01g03100.t1
MQAAYTSIAAVCNAIAEAVAQAAAAAAAVTDMERDAQLLQWQLVPAAVVAVMSSSSTRCSSSHSSTWLLSRCTVW